MPVNAKRKSFTVEVSEKETTYCLQIVPATLPIMLHQIAPRHFKELFVDIYDRIDHSFKRKDLLI